MDGQKTVRHSLWPRLTGWLKRHRERIYFGIALVVIIGAGLGVLDYLKAGADYPPPTNSLSVAPKKKEPPKFYSPLTGELVPNEAATKRQVTAIMIENSTSARPQSGLKAAGVVFEAIAEGGITRFVALYQNSRPGLIGPVRSVRPYFVEWLAPFDSAVAHIGGSKRALDMVRGGTFKDIDQFFNAQAYWRATDRYAPHNVYTSFDKLDALNAAKGYVSSSFSGFPRKPDKPSPQPTATKIQMDISSGLYNVSYLYNPSDNNYLRFQGGQPHLDRETGQLAPKVAIAIKVPMSLGFEDGWREQINTIGSGQAYVFQDGTVTEGTWRKTGVKDQIQFLDPAGKTIQLNAGQTWITAVPNNKTVSWQ